jgi:D-lactate dehydrogenase
MCQSACPVAIDTGQLIKELRAAAHGRLSQRTAALAATHFRELAAAARTGLRLGALARALPLGDQVLELASASLGSALPGVVPRVPPSLVLPRAARRIGPEPPSPLPARATGPPPGAVYFPSCLTRIVGPLPGENGVAPARALRESLRAAGFAVTIPPHVSGLCCGMAFASKGHAVAARLAAARTADALWRATSGGRLPVVTDASPCAGFMADAVDAALRDAGRVVRIFDFPAFWAREVLPTLERPPRRAGIAIVHPTCTLVKAGGLDDLLAVAGAHAERVVVPRFAECCGFAGDRGFLVPELTAAATRDEAAEVRELVERDPDAACYSTCRTCEIGMTRATGRPFRPLAALVHESMTRA